MEEIKKINLKTLVLVLLFALNHGCQSEHQNKEEIPMSKTEAQAATVIDTHVVMKTPPKVMIDNKPIIVKLKPKEMAKNEALVTKVTKDIEAGQYSGMTCDSILAWYIKEFYLKYKETGEEKYLSGFPNENAKIVGCMNENTIKIVFDSLQKETRKLKKQFIKRKG